MGKAKDLYEDWHAFGHKDVINIDIPVSKGKLTNLGEMHRLDYISDKWEGQDIYYYHHFKKNPPKLLKDEKGNIFIAGNIKVTDLGIDDWDQLALIDWEKPQSFKKLRRPTKAVTKLGILELIVYIDPKTKKRKTLTFGDRYYVADPKADWTFISSPINIPVSNPTLRQEIHNALKSHRLPLDALQDRNHPKYKKAIEVLKKKKLYSRYKEVGTRTRKPNPKMLPLPASTSLVNFGAITLFAAFAGGLLTHIVSKVIDEWWAQARKSNPSNIKNWEQEYGLIHESVMDVIEDAMDNIKEVFVKETGRLPTGKEILDTLTQSLSGDANPVHRVEVDYTGLFAVPEEKFARVRKLLKPYTVKKDMPQMGFKCPACEHRFKLRRPIPRMIPCPKCKRSFEFSRKKFDEYLRFLRDCLIAGGEVAKRNPVKRCIRPVDDSFYEWLYPAFHHVYFDVDGKHVGLQLVEGKGSYVGYDKPERKRARTISDCETVPVNEECLMDLVQRDKDFGYEPKTLTDALMGLSCIGWAKEAMDKCAQKQNPVEISPPWALDEWFTPKEESAILAVDVAKQVGAHDAYYEPSEKGNYRIHIKWRIEESNPTDRQIMICSYLDIKAKFPQMPDDEITSIVARRFLDIGFDEDYWIGKVTEVLKDERLVTNPSLNIPIHSKEQLQHVYNAQDELGKAGVTFDTSYAIEEEIREWQLDWSLKGAELSGQSGMPISQMTFIDKHKQKFKSSVSGFHEHIWEIFFDGNDEFRIFRDGEHWWRSDDYFVKEADERWAHITKRKGKVKKWHKEEERRMKKMKNPTQEIFSQDITVKWMNDFSKKFKKTAKIKDYFGKEIITYPVHKDHNKILPSKFRQRVRETWSGKNEYYELLPGYGRWTWSSDPENDPAHHFNLRSEEFDRFLELYGFNYEDVYTAKSKAEYEYGYVPAHSDYWGKILFKGKQVGYVMRETLTGGHLVSIYKWPIAALKHAKQYLMDHNLVAKEPNPRPAHITLNDISKYIHMAEIHLKRSDFDQAEKFLNLAKGASNTLTDEEIPDAMKYNMRQIEELISKPSPSTGKVPYEKVETYHLGSVTELPDGYYVQFNNGMFIETFKVPDWESVKKLIDGDWPIEEQEGHASSVHDYFKIEKHKKIRLPDQW